MIKWENTVVRVHTKHKSLMVCEGKTEIPDKIIPVSLTMGS